MSSPWDLTNINSPTIVEPIGNEAGINNFHDVNNPNAFIDNVMVNKTKTQFNNSEFTIKYNKILSKTTDPIIKSENIKLCTAAIITTLKKHFCKEDPDDTTELNQFMEQILIDNVELQTYFNKLQDIKNKKTQRIVSDDINDIDDIDDIDDINVEEYNKQKNELAIENAKMKEKAIYNKAKHDLNNLMKKRQQEIEGIFTPPNQSDINRIFGDTNTQENIDDIDDIDDNINKTTRTDWFETTQFMKQLNISTNMIELLTNLNSFREELNDTHKYYQSLQDSIEKFNNVITSQLTWIQSMPDCLDGSIIRNNIEETMEKYFQKEDVIQLFKNYKQTHNKMMLMIAFVPREFMSHDACAVCLSNPKNIVLVPCGHTCCSTCSQSLSECMMCRTKIDSKQKMYST